MTAELASIVGQLEALASTATGSVSLAIRNLHSGYSIRYEAERVVASASVIKLPILVAALGQAEVGAVDLERVVPVPEEARVGGSGILKELRADALTVRDLLTLMTVLSDNTATNVCLDLVGFAPVNECVRRAGCGDTRCERLLMDHAARDRGFRNETTAADMAEFVTRLARGDLLTAESTAQAMDMLRRQQSRWGLPRRLPAGVDLAHKTGELKGLRHDVGVLSVGEQSFAIAVLCDGFARSTPDNLIEGEASDLVASVGKLVHEAMTAGSPGR